MIDGYDWLAGEIDGPAWAAGERTNDMHSEIRWNGSGLELERRGEPREAGAWQGDLGGGARRGKSAWLIAIHTSLGL